MAGAPEGANGKKAPSLEALTRAALRARAWTVRFGGRCSGLPALALLEARASRGAPGGWVGRVRGFSPARAARRALPATRVRVCVHVRACAVLPHRGTCLHGPGRPRELKAGAPSAPGAEVGEQTAADLALEAPRRWVAVPPPPLAVVSAPTPQPCHRS